jgi:hypothetical protein
MMQTLRQATGRSYWEELARELVDLGEERCPCVGRRLFHGRRQAYERGATVKWMRVTGDVSRSLEAMN